MDVLIKIGFAILGAALSLLGRYLSEKYKFRKEFKSNNEIDLTGSDWTAAWQTNVDGKPLLNTEDLCISQKGGTVKVNNKHRSPENPKGGYLWDGQLDFYNGRDLMGWYFSKKSEQNTNKGIMYFNYDSAKKLFIGVWVGCSYDGPLMSGFGVIAKTKQQALSVLRNVCAKHNNQVTIISHVV